MFCFLGKFATSKAGHDKGKIYVVVAESENYVQLSDGHLKPYASPKKKNKRHIQIINCHVGGGLLGRLVKQEGVTDEQIKYEIKQYQKQAAQEGASEFEKER